MIMTSGLRCLRQNMDAFGVARLGHNRQVGLGFQKRSQSLAIGGSRVRDHNSNGSYLSGHRLAFNLDRLLN